MDVMPGTCRQQGQAAAAIASERPHATLQSPTFLRVALVQGRQTSSPLHGQSYLLFCLQSLFLVDDIFQMVLKLLVDGIACDTSSTMICSLAAPCALLRKIVVKWGREKFGRRAHEQQAGRWRPIVLGTSWMGRLTLRIAATSAGIPPAASALRPSDTSFMAARFFAPAISLCR